MRVLVVDNYDSFTYNLVQYIEKFLQQKVEVLRNDAIDLEEVVKYDKIVLSPGPGIPDEANLLKPLIQEYYATKSILGVCLGHQAISEVFGATLLNTQKVYHGIASSIEVTHPSSIFTDLPKTMEVGRYHSWVVDTEGFPEDEFRITAYSPEGYIMAIQHRKYDVQGVQFHPESILTPQGYTMITNWLQH